MVLVQLKWSPSSILEYVNQIDNFITNYDLDREGIRVGPRKPPFQQDLGLDSCEDSVSH